MLILTRRLGESIMINDDISIKLLNIDHKQVKLGVTAPPHLSVHREEVYQRILREREQGKTDSDKD